MLALQQSPFPIDENGIEIRPGYRPPFKKGEFDPRRFVPPKGVRPKHLHGSTPNLLAATRRAFRKHAMAIAAAIDPDLAMRHAQVCKLLFAIERELCGERKLHPKPHLAHVAPMAKVAPISTVDSGQKVSPLVKDTGLGEIHSVSHQESGNQSVENASVKPASEQAPVAPVKAVSPIPAILDEDCPF